MVGRGFVFAFSLACLAATYPTIGNRTYAAFPETYLDLIQPTPSSLTVRPLVIAIHGPAKKSDMARWYTPFLEKGYIVANLEYRSEDDVLQAVTWLREHAARYQLDLKRVVVLGIGDGASLAAKAPGVTATVALEVNGDPDWPRIFKRLRKAKAF